MNIKNKIFILIFVLLIIIGGFVFYLAIYPFDVDKNIAGASLQSALQNFTPLPDENLKDGIIEAEEPVDDFQIVQEPVVLVAVKSTQDQIDDLLEKIDILKRKIADLQE